MTPINFYYRVKRLIPRRIQIALRRIIAAHKRRITKDVWPILPIAAKKPEGWGVWPDKKMFALVLNHDVDTMKGVLNCTKLMEIEMQLGFRSCFNFVPEDYPTPPALRKKLTEFGFEVGVHGLRHDGKLFASPKAFYKQATRVNHYLKEWGAEGFTSPSMLRNFSLMAELDIKHGCSTFDTDPFEPQSDGVSTIFPFYVMNSWNSRSYLELPYTLPQDHGLFIILKEKDNRIWKQKLDWLAEKGGMALLNSHPDYMNFGKGRPPFEEYPVSHYTDFLEYIKKKYEGRYWHVLPREISRFWKESVPIDRNRLRPKGEGAVSPIDTRSIQATQGPRARPIKIWIDLDNTPHVPFFIPIINELQRRGYQVVLTARDAFQVCELADQKGMRYTKIGHHYGKNRVMKVVGLFWRLLQLLPFCLNQKPALAVSHGARSQILLCKLLRIPAVLVADYEHTRSVPMGRPKWLIVPESLFGCRFSVKASRVRFYRGIKEDVYVPRFRPNPALLNELNLSHGEVIITVRPPANEAHYYNPESDVLFEEFMSRICQTPGTRVVLLPRNHHQEGALRTAHPNWFSSAKTIVPPRALDGLNLLWFSDLVVSGGGTMNREAAALGIPVYSIFRGKSAAVDRTLEQEGRLTMIRDANEIWNKIQIVRREKNLSPNMEPREALKDIIDNLEDIIRIERIGTDNHRNSAKTDG